MQDLASSNQAAATISGSDIASIVGAVATLVSILFAYLKWYLPWRHKAKEKGRRKRETAAQETVMQGMARLNDAYSAMYGIVSATKASRVILFAGHNSGGIPNAGNPFYLSAVHWFFVADHRAKFVGYKNLAVDGHLVKALIDLRTDLLQSYVVAQMEACQLKDYLRLEGVEHCVLCYVGVFDRQFLFLSIANYDASQPFTQEDLTTFRLQSHNVAEAIRQARESQ